MIDTLSTDAVRLTLAVALVGMLAASPAAAAGATTPAVTDAPTQAVENPLDGGTADADPGQGIVPDDDDENDDDGGSRYPPFSPPT